MNLIVLRFPTLKLTGVYIPAVFSPWTWGYPCLSYRRSWLYWFTCRLKALKG